MVGATCGKTPEIVAAKDCRYDVAVVLDEEAAAPFVPEGEVGRYDFSPMLVANLPISGGIELEQRALDWLFGTWLPESGYEPDDQPAFEAWAGLPFGARVRASGAELPAGGEAGVRLEVAERAANQ